MKTSISEISNPFDVHRELFKHLDSFEGMTFDGLKETLEAEGFRDMGKTPGVIINFMALVPRKSVQKFISDLTVKLKGSVTRGTMVLVASITKGK